MSANDNIIRNKVIAKLKDARTSLIDAIANEENQENKEWLRDRLNKINIIIRKESKKCQ